MKILSIDTSQQALGIALVEDGRPVASYVSLVNKNHSIRLMPGIEFLMQEHGWSAKDLTRVVVAEGPGSYTGIRIGVTTAKTLAWTLGIELVGVSSLAAIAVNSQFSGLIVPLCDARRNNVYTGAYQWQNGELVSLLPDQHISLSAWLEELAKQELPVQFVGVDVPVFEDMIQETFKNKQVEAHILTNQLNPLGLAYLGSLKTPEADVENFTPKYLKRVEAEENWLKNHPDVTKQEYVKRI